MLEEKKTKIRMPGSKRHKNMNTAAVAMTMQTVVLSLARRLKPISFGSIHLYFYVESMGCFDSSRFSPQLFFSSSSQARDKYCMQNKTGTVTLITVSRWAIFGFLFLKKNYSYSSSSQRPTWKATKIDCVGPRNPI
jgi:hypothetical protein